jgi:hypothetical protein
MTTDAGAEAIRTDGRKKIGSMPRKDCDPELTPVDPVLGDDGCPKCGAEMESIETGAEGPPIQQLQLCPHCYLVTWSDQDGLHVQQGVPVKIDLNSHNKPEWLVGHPKEC